LNYTRSLLSFVLLSADFLYYTDIKSICQLSFL